MIQERGEYASGRRARGWAADPSTPEVKLRGADLREGKAGIMAFAAAHGVGKSRSGSQCPALRLEAILSMFAVAAAWLAVPAAALGRREESHARRRAAHAVSLGESDRDIPRAIAWRSRQGDR